MGAMGIQRYASGFRARLKQGHRTYNGPVRETDVAPGEDEVVYKRAASQSIEKLEEVHEAQTCMELKCLLTGCFAKSGKEAKCSNWYVEPLIFSLTSAGQKQRILRVGKH